jgi:hypothetical protein
MISNVTTARLISELMLDVFYRIDESVSVVRQTCAEDEAVAYSKAIGRLAGSVVMDILEPLYEKNPELKPPHWDTGAC